MWWNTKKYPNIKYREILKLLQKIEITVFGLDIVKYCKLMKVAEYGKNYYEKSILFFLAGYNKILKNKY